MKTYNGTYLVLMLETVSGSYKAVAHATGHNLNISRKTRETSGKSTGQAEGKEYGRYTWGVSVDGMISFDTDICNIATLRGLIIAGTKVKLLSVLLDYETSGKAPLADASAIVVRDATGDDNIDSATTTIETTADNFAMTSVFSGMTPQAVYGQACITGVDESATDGETATFSASFEGDEDLLLLATAAFV